MITERVLCSKNDVVVYTIIIQGKKLSNLFCKTEDSPSHFPQVSIHSLRKRRSNRWRRFEWSERQIFRRDSSRTLRTRQDKVTWPDLPTIRTCPDWGSRSILLATGGRSDPWRIGRNRRTFGRKRIRFGKDIWSCISVGRCFFVQKKMKSNYLLGLFSIVNLFYTSMSTSLCSRTIATKVF